MNRRQLLTATAAAFSTGFVPVTTRIAFAQADALRNPLAAAAINFFTFADQGDDKKNGSTIFCQLEPTQQPPGKTVVYAQNDASATTPAFPDDNTWADQHGFPHGIQLVLLADAPLYYDEWTKASANLAFVGVDQDTWKCDFHIQLKFANGQIVRRFKNGLLFNTTGGSHQGYNLSTGLADDPANHFG